MEIAGYPFDLEFFGTMFLLGLGLATLGAGLFTAYFGAGTSRKVGFALLALAVIVLAALVYLTFPQETFDERKFWEALVAGLAAVVGITVGMILVLFVLMKVDTVDDLEDLDLEDLEDLDLDEELKKLEAELEEEEGAAEEEAPAGEEAPAEAGDETKEDET